MRKKDIEREGWILPKSKVPETLRSLALLFQRQELATPNDGLEHMQCLPLNSTDDPDDSEYGSCCTRAQPQWLLDVQQLQLEQQEAERNVEIGDDAQQASSGGVVCGTV